MRDADGRDRRAAPGAGARALYVSPDAPALRRRDLRFPSAPIHDALLRERLRALGSEAPEWRERALAEVLDLLVRRHGRPAREFDRLARFAREMDEAATLLREGFAEKMTAPALGRRFAMGPTKFIRAFGARHGLSPAAFQMSVRIERAQVALAEGTPLAEAALECGFYDQSHFVRFFRRYVGTTPSRFQLHAESYKRASGESA